MARAIELYKEATFWLSRERTVPVDRQYWLGVKASALSVLAFG